jgi:FtsH-binding integral membrane protein
VTVNAASPAVTHDDGVQNHTFVRGLARRIPTALGAALVGLVSVLVVLFWLYTLVVTWIGHGNLSTPFFQTTVAAVLVIGVAAFARKTLGWLGLLVIAAAWCILSGLPLLPIVQVLVQAVLVALMVAAAVFAVVAAEQAERPRF